MVAPKIRKQALSAGYRSGLEQDNARHLEAHKCNYDYEKHVINYIPKPKRYTPDFLLDNGIFVETKGRFTASDRAKHILVKEQHPNLDIRFVFTNPNQRISKRSKTTYADWCDKHGFKYAHALVPVEWIKEKPKK
jgi:hypothetical protein